MVFPRAILVAVWDLLVVTATVLVSRQTHDVSCPTVTLDGGTFIGTTANGTNRFLGIPFAHPPSVLYFGSAPHPLWLTLQSDRVGDLRFRLPKPLGPYAGKHNATVFGLSCPQQSNLPLNLKGFPQSTLDTLSSVFGTGVTVVDGEDCEDSEAIGRLPTIWRTILTTVVGLKLNVVAPSNVTPGSKIPVVVVCIL
jgi:acetylcholinesterase